MFDYFYIPGHDATHAADHALANHALADHGTFSLPLVILSYVVASLASYLALILAHQLILPGNQARQRQLIYTGGSLALGAGIWSMHFIGMLAYEMDMPMSYDPALTGLSLVIAIVSSFCVLWLVGRQNLRAWQIALGAIFLGIGISAMHYTGMLAMTVHADVRYRPDLYAVSILIAIAASWAALWLCFKTAWLTGSTKRILTIGAALVMGLAICGMHYTGMLAAVFFPHDHEHAGEIAETTSNAVLVIVLIGVVICLLAPMVIYRQLDDRVERDSTSPFPTRLLLMAVLGTLISFAWITGYALYGDHILKSSIRVDAIAGDIGQHLLQAENSLKDLSKKAVLSGTTASEPDYDKVYAGVIENLNDAARQMGHIYTTDDHQKTLASLSNFNGLNKSIFDAVRNGNPAQAKDVLNSDQYVKYKTDFATRIHGLILNMEEAASEDLENISHTFTTMAYIVVGMALLLIVAWYYSLYNIRIWRQELRDNKALMNTIIDNMPLALFVKDVSRDFRMALFNKAAEDTFCVKKEDIIGHTDYDFFPKAEADFFRDTDKRVMELRQIVDIEAEPVTTQKGTFIGHTIKVPVYKPDGTPHLLLGMLEDVTERIRAREELREAKERAEKADQTKSEFLANMSHELRTPLNSILGMSRLLLGSDMNEEHKNTLKTVYQSSTQLLELVNDILDLSKIEANQVELEQIGFDPAYVAESTTESLRQIAREKKLRLDLEVGDLPYLVGDPTRLSRIFTNLVGNGIKYTDIGRVVVRVRAQPLEVGSVSLIVEIEDTGIGIPADKLDSVFEKFVQADSTTTRRFGGTGLGLAITRQLVEMMGGAITVRSGVGQGTTFKVIIPFRVTDTLEERASAKRARLNIGTLPPAGVRVLIAEDHAMNKIFMTKLMQSFGIPNYRIVDNGRLAVEAYQETEWDLILMDCHMPELNGYDATESIREIESGTGRNVPIIAMTANAMVGDREKCLRYGMDDYISKPIAYDEMKAILAQWIRFGDDAADTIENMVEPVSHIDLSLLHSFTDDLETLRQIAEAFYAQSDQNIAQLEAACVDGVSKAWTEAGHMMKGGSRQLGAEILGDLCAAAQDMLDTTAARRRALLADIRAEYALVCHELKARTEG